MMNIREILGNATMAQANMKKEIDENKIIQDIFDLINQAKPDIIKANQIDIKNKNGFEIDFQKIKAIENEIKSIEIKQTKNIGTICIVYDGNIYSLLELALKAILTHNSVILTSEIDYMKATNNLFITLIRRVLEDNEVDKNLIQKLYTNKTEELLSNIARINKVIAIGSKEFQERIKKYSGIEVVSSGYGNFDIYIEDASKLDIIEDMTDKKDTVNIYVKKGVEVPFKKYATVESLEEAIALINLNTAGYSSTIFTSDIANAEEFIKEVKSDNTYANQNPFFNSILDISINEFIRLKNVAIENQIQAMEEVEKSKKQQEKIEKDNITLKEDNETLRRQNDMLEERIGNIKRRKRTNNRTKRQRNTRFKKTIRRISNISK